MKILKRYSLDFEEGQGLVEYAFILVMVAIVVIGILISLGPQVGRVFSRVVTALDMQTGGGVVTGVSAQRTGDGNGNDVVVTITVSTNSSITVSDSQNASPVTTTCSGSCTVTLSGVGLAAGTVTVTATAGGSGSDTYAAKL